METWKQFIQIKNQQILNKRERLIRNSSCGNQIKIANSLFYNYQSNDYLGLSSHSLVKNSTIDTIHEYGIGSTGAPTLGGYTDIHDDLQKKLACWLSYESSLLFSSGYQMNVSLFTQLVNENVYVWLDKNCHASHIDGALFSRAKFTRFNIENINQIREKVISNDLLHLIITEGVYSMDGINKDLPSLFALKKEFPERILLIVDDAHGIGCLGDNGYGTIELLKLDFKDCDILLGTFGKAFGSHGGFLCTNHSIAKYLRYSVRSQIFSTNLPPSVVSASSKSLEIIQSAECGQLRNKLQQNIKYFKMLTAQYELNIFHRDSNNSPIQLILLDSTDKVAKVYQSLYEDSILIGKIIYPTVPLNTPRLRISLSAYHSESDIELLVKSIHYLLREFI
ncbi:MAG: pyridoxal phosphate-dependent aminotransferase family protein [Burkholderiales bacterium]|nr:pyridoxal phosphate-dependent aminotransferase family protein [Burkholderiales bacterium]